MNKPIDLIVANEVHSIAAALNEQPPNIRIAIKMLDKITPNGSAAAICDNFLRNTLCAIAHQAHASHVTAALRHLGVDVETGIVMQRIRAARDALAEPGKAAP